MSTGALRLPLSFDPTASAYKDWLHVNLLHHGSGQHRVHIGHEMGCGKRLRQGEGPADRFDSGLCLAPFQPKLP